MGAVVALHAGNLDSQNEISVSRAFEFDRRDGFDTGLFRDKVSQEFPELLFAPTPSGRDQPAADSVQKIPAAEMGPHGLIIFS